MIYLQIINIISRVFMLALNTEVAESSRSVGEGNQAKDEMAYGYTYGSCGFCICFVRCVRECTVFDGRED